MFTCNHQKAQEYFKIFWSDSNKLILELKKSFLIKTDKINLDKNQFSQEFGICLVCQFESTLVYFTNNLVQQLRSSIFSIVTKVWNFAQSTPNTHSFQ